MNTTRKIYSPKRVLIFLIRLNVGVPLLIYGVLKLFRIQFAIPSEFLDTPFSEVDLFTLSWYVAGHEPFQSFLGCLELVVGTIIIISRYYLAASLAAFFMLMHILIWDITFMPYNLPVILLLAELIIACVVNLILHKEKIAMAMKQLKV